MELTDTRPQFATEPSVVRAQPVGLAGLLGTGDHKVIGRALIVLSIGVVAAAEVLSTVLRADVYDTKTHQLLSADRFRSLLTLQPIGLVFVGLIPLLLGIALLVVPLQVGSRSIAFPRAAAAGFWAYFVSGGLLILSYFIDGGPGGNRASAVDLWALSFIMLIAAILLLSVTVVTTVFTNRAPGMTLTRVPLFSWSMVVAGVLWIMTLPVAAAMLLLVYIDHRHGRIFIGNDLNGATFTQVSWLFRQPQIYALAIPALGIIGDIVVTFSRAREDFRHSVSMSLVGFFAILSFGAFSVTSYATYPAGTAANTVFSNPLVIFMSILIVIPVLAMCGQVADSFRRGKANGKPVAGAPLPLALCSLLLLVLAVLIGAFDPIKRFGLHGTLYSDAQFRLVSGATILAALAGMFYWSSKITGSKAADLGGYGAALLGLAGTVAFAVGNVLSATGGPTAQHFNGTEAFNTLSGLGAAGITGAVFVGAITVAVAVASRQTQTEADPWGAGQTLEWATKSPPIYENFVEVMPVRSEAPLLDLLETTEGDAT